MRVDEGRKGCSLLAIRMKAPTVVGRAEKGLFSGPGSELRLGGEKEKEECNAYIWDEQKQNNYLILGKKFQPGQKQEILT